MTTGQTRRSKPGRKVSNSAAGAKWSGQPKEYRSRFANGQKTGGVLFEDIPCNWKNWHGGVRVTRNTPERGPASLVPVMRTGTEMRLVSDSVGRRAMLSARQLTVNDSLLQFLSKHSPTALILWHSRSTLHANCLMYCQQTIRLMNASSEWRIRCRGPSKPAAARIVLHGGRLPYVRRLKCCELSCYD
jgi:hypothetical protein